jgi:hypothetical protein
MNKLIDYILFGKIKRKVIDQIDFTECEIEYRGRNNKLVGYWAYGFYDWELPYPRNRNELLNSDGYYIIL